MSEFPEIDLYTEVDDELYEELAELAGEKVVHVEVWEESLGDVMAPDEDAPSGQFGFDIDLYLECGLYFELYSAVCYPTLEGDPLEGLAVVQKCLSSLTQSSVWLEEIAVDEENALVLILAQRHKPQLYLLIGAWTIGEWDELPAA